MNNVPPPPRDAAHPQAAGAGTPPPGPFMTQLHELLTTLLNPSAAVHGDAVYTQEALDRIITQLMEANPQSNAAPPASAEAIEKLEKKPLDEKMMGVDGKVECTICMDELHKGDEVSVLPCKHWFHPECVNIWLKEHNTCPMCRTPIEERSSQPGPNPLDGNPANPAPQGAGNSGPDARPTFWPTRPSRTTTVPNPNGGNWVPLSSLPLPGLQNPGLQNSGLPRGTRTAQQNEDRLNAIRSTGGLGPSPRQSSREQSRRNSHSPPSRESTGAVRVRSPSASRSRDREETPRDQARNHWSYQWSSQRSMSGGARQESGDDTRNRPQQEESNTSAGNSSSHNPFSWIRNHITRDRSGGNGGDAGNDAGQRPS